MIIQVDWTYSPVTSLAGHEGPESPPLLLDDLYSIAVEYAWNIGGPSLLIDDQSETSTRQYLAMLSRLRFPSHEGRYHGGEVYDKNTIYKVETSKPKINIQCGLIPKTTLSNPAGAVRPHIGNGPTSKRKIENPAQGLALETLTRSCFLMNILSLEYFYVL